MISINNTTATFMPQHIDLPAIDSCQVMDIIWQETKKAALTNPMLVCNDNACGLSLSDKVITFGFEKLDSKCAFILVAGAPDEEVKTTVTVAGDKHVITTTANDKSLQATTDFKNYFHSEWIDATTLTDGEFSLNIDPQSPEAVSFKLKNGPSELVGDCQIGNNAVSCVLKGGGIASLFYSVNVEMSKKQDLEGIIHYSFDVTANSMLPFTSPKNLGNFEFHMDPTNNQVKAAGLVKNADGATLFNGTLECTDAETCDAQAKLSMVSESGATTETAMNWQHTPSKLNTTLSSKQTYDELIRSFGYLNSEENVNILFQQERKDDFYGLTGEVRANKKRNDKLTVETTAKMELEIEENRQALKGSVKENHLRFGSTFHAQAEASHRIKGNNEIYEMEFEGPDGTEFSTKYSTPRKQ